ncbi:MAG: DUF5671 domain-containing protein [Patescibacteria group bacterium]
MPQTNERLQDFIAKARAAGKSTELIRELLLKSGWTTEQVAPYLDSGDELVPPPPPAPKSSGRDIFFYLLAFLTLGISAVALGNILFSVINRYFSDVVANAGYYYGSATLTQALASLIVAAPVYYLVTWKINHDLARGIIQGRSNVRKILTFLVLFFASATVIGDIITLVYRFVSGEVNTRFILKVVVVLLIGGWISWYYWITLRQDERAEHEPGYQVPLIWRRGHSLALAIVVLSAIVSGFIIVGSPANRQAFVRDQARVGDLQQISFGIQNYYNVNNTLPKVLVDINNVPNMTIPIDPRTKSFYEYKPGGQLIYQLCTTFELPSVDENDIYGTKPYYSVSGVVNWSHPEGYYCFNLSAQSQPKL